MESPEKLNEDILFLACTRPAAFAGAPLEAWFVILVSTGLVFLAGGSLLYLASGFFSYAVCRAVCRHDPNQFAVLFAWMETKLRCRTRAWWGASTVSPLRLRELRSWRELKKQGA